MKEKMMEHNVRKNLRAKQAERILLLLLLYISCLRYMGNSERSQLSTRILKLAVLSETGQNIVHSVRIY